MRVRQIPKYLLLPTSAILLMVLAACASKPLTPWTADATPLVFSSLAQAGVDDQRGRFREIFCNVLESRAGEWPDYMPCEQALTRVAGEPPGLDRTVDLGVSKRQLLALFVPGVGWDCVANWLENDHTTQKLLQSSGYEVGMLKVDALSSSSNNARQIRDGIAALPPELSGRPIVLIGYSKGAPDVLEAIVAYPELQQQVVAVLSVAGSVGGSPLANTADQGDLNIMRHFPGSECDAGDGGAIESLRPATRRTWLMDHPLPQGIAWYSLVTYPQPDRISSILKSSYRKLSLVDARNDSQMIYYDQIIPGSTLLGFANADHWALAVPIARSHSFIGSTFVNHNDYPREALTEAALRFIEENLELRQKALNP